MATFGERFKMLREEKKMKQQELMDDFNRKYNYSFNKSAVSQYENDKRIPEISALSDFADYFGVSIDFLLGKTDVRTRKEPQLTKKDERDISKKMKSILEDLDNAEDALMFDGEVLDEETKELLKSSLENSLRMGKIVAKNKFTPKKYKK